MAKTKLSPASVDDNYTAFLESKQRTATAVGFEVSKLPDKLFAFQKAIVQWSCRLGRCAILADTGLGKTAMQLAWADAVQKKTKRPVLILAPLAVGPQTKREAAKFGIKNVKLVESGDEVESTGIHVTNYHKLHKFDPTVFAGVVLDESSILKSFMGKIKRQLIEAFADTPYRLACTATPAPNDHMELGNHAEFLGVMPSNEMLSRWFINDPGKVGAYRLKGHAESDFWRWMSSWSVCLSKPSDLGYPDDGYDLPPLTIKDRVVEVDVTENSGNHLVRSDSLSATNLHREMKLTAPERAKAVSELLAAEPDVPWLVWCNTDYEQDELERLIPDAASVRGSDTDSVKEDCLLGFADGKYRVLITKPSIAGWGLNYQHCNRVAFVGLSYSFEQLYQAVRRCWRFGQTKEVTAYIVQAITEGEVMKAVRDKQDAHERMRTDLTAAVREFWTENQSGRKLQMDAPSNVTTGKGWEMRHGDCVEEVKKLADESIDFTIFSPPFSNLYIYSDSLRDMGNSTDDEEFFGHFKYLIPELLRVTVPGRLCAVHCKDLPLYRGRDGSCGLKDFPGDTIRAFSESGWIYHSRVTIWKCPVVERERTNNNGLLHKTVTRDTSQVRQGMADYLLIFRKNPVADNLSSKPIVREKGLTEWPGAPEFDPRTNPYHPSKFARKAKEQTNESVKIWQRLADPVWWHIDQMDVLNYELGKGPGDERHICPLQLGVIKEAVELWTNPGDTVLSPFAGIGSEGYQSIVMGRKFVGLELKEDYVKIAVRNLTNAVKKANEPKLFDSISEAV